MNAAANPTDPQLTALVGELSIADEQFCQWWAARNVARQELGLREYIGRGSHAWQLAALVTGYSLMALPIPIAAWPLATASTIWELFP